MKNPGRVGAGEELQSKLRKNSLLNIKRIKGIIRAYKNPSYKKKLSRAQCLRFKKASERKKLSKAGKKHWTPARRREESRMKKEYYRKNPQVIKRIDKTMTSWWREHPHVKKKRAEQVKQFFIRHPAAFKKFLIGGKNNSKLSIKTKQGFLVRSKREKIITDWLYRKGIRAEYEKHTILLESWPCTPDWWMPKYKCFVEYYGGHPRSRKKKIIKNKLYRKYKIPCIFITPAELRDLDYYLLRDAEKLSKLSWVKKFRVGKWLYVKL